MTRGPGSLHPDRDPAMLIAEPDAPLERLVERWRGTARRRARSASAVERLETALREDVGRLTAVGLTADEAFLVAERRAGERLAAESPARSWAEARAAVGLAVVAALLVKLPALFGADLDAAENVYVRNLALFVLPPLAAYFVWQRGLAGRTVAGLAAAFLAALAFVNLCPFVPGADTEILAALHLPIALWLAVGIAHAAGRWGEVAGRMDFIRFSGELVIQYVLIAIGGGLLTGMLFMIFRAIGIDVEPFVQQWLVPCGAAGAVLVAAWLVEARPGVIGNMAPVLTRLFTPLFAAVLIAFLAAVLATGRGVSIEREVLIGFDLLLALVVCLLLYSVSARDPEAPPGVFDVVQVVLVVAALAADLVALSAIAARIGEFGFTPNRVAALGENVILLANLAGSALLYLRFLRGRAPFGRLERWQTDFLPVYAGWAALVVVAFPPLFAGPR